MSSRVWGLHEGLAMVSLSLWGVHNVIIDIMYGKHWDIAICISEAKHNEPDNMQH